MINIILFTLALIVLLIGSYTDIKTREVPDWINFGLIFTGIGIRAIYSAVTWDWTFLIYGLVGLVSMIALGYITFYAGIWGGGDAKMLMGIGAVLGIPFTFEPFPLLFIFLINAIVVGGVYGLIYTFVLAIKHRKTFVKNLKQIIHNKTMMKIRRYSLISFIVLAILIMIFVKNTLFLWMFIFLLFLMYFTFVLIILTKAVEKSAMYKYVPPKELTEGDWIANDIIINGKHIVGPKSLGIEKKQIAQLIRLKVKKIKIKQGIPYIPAYLIAYILSFYGAWWLVLL